MKVSREHINAAATATYRHTADELGKRCNSATCESVCRRLAGVIEAKFDALKAAGAAIACAPGCNFCCHLRVSVFRHEAIALLHYLRTSLPPLEAAAIEARIMENARKIERLTVEEHRAANIRCAFLVGGLCSAHAVRPSACATYHSMSRDRCEYSFEHPQDIGTPNNHRPALLELQAFGNAAIEATEAGLENAGVSNEKAELHQLLRALIEDSSAVEQWCAGGALEPALRPD